MSVFKAEPSHSSFLLTAKVFLGIALFSGAPCLGAGLVTKFNDARASETWPQALATITESKVLKRSPHIIYIFEVEGRRYSGKSITFESSESRSWSGADELTQKYSVGTQHPVFYDPANPGNCVLEKGPGWFH